MKERRISEAVGNIRPKYIEQAADYRVRKKPMWIRWSAAAACVALAVAAVILINRRQPEVPQPSHLAAVIYGDEGISQSVEKHSLEYLTEDELFAFAGYAFRGRVESLQNITIDFGPASLYKCIARIRIEKVYKGDIQPGEAIKMLLPCPILERKSQEDTGIISRIKVGMEGIFMPYAYGADSYIAMYDKVFYESQVAPCGLGDGMRFAFLQTERGLAFSRSDYKCAADAKTLEDIEAYVTERLSRTASSQ